MTNEHEARARARKAYRIARVLVRAVRDHGQSLDDYEAAGEPVRETAARVARVRKPSTETWAQAVAIAREQLAESQEEEA